MEAQEWAILGVALLLIINVAILPDLLEFYDSSKIFFSTFQEKFIIVFQSFLGFAFSWKGLLLFLIISLPFILYYNYRININISQKLIARKQKIRKAEEEIESIERLLNTNINNLDIEGLKSHINKLIDKRYLSNRFREPEKVYERFDDKENRSRKLLKKRRRERELQKYRDKKERLKRENEEIREENERLRLEQENKNVAILRELDAGRTNVFFREHLSEEEIEALHEDGFEDSNEYDICERRVVAVLVKKIMNHSKTHTFLVWSVRQLLEEMGADDIQEHETVYPDLTFTYNREEFAIEVELGSLLRKKQQMRDKVKFLKSKFGWNWIFVVSNKNLVSKYRKHGNATQRSEVEKSLKKMINSDL